MAKATALLIAAKMQRDETRKHYCHQDHSFVRRMTEADVAAVAGVDAVDSGYSYQGCLRPSSSRPSDCSLMANAYVSRQLAFFREKRATKLNEKKTMIC